MTLKVVKIKKKLKKLNDYRSINKKNYIKILNNFMNSTKKNYQVTLLK